MLQDLPTFVDSQRALPAEPGLAETATAAFCILRRQILIVIFFLLIGTMCGACYAWFLPPAYTAHAEILFDRRNRPVVQERSILEGGPFDAHFFESQINILQSERLASMVIATLDLWRASEFAGSGEGLGGYMRDYFSRVFYPASPLPKSDADLKQEAAAALLQKLSAKRVNDSFIIEISFQSNDPNRAAQIANAVADTYIADQMDAKRESIHRANDWLRGRLNELRRQALADEHAVDSYKADNKIINAQGVPINEQAITELNRELSTARAKTSEALARLERIEAILRNDSLGGSNDATVAEALSSRVMVKLREEYLQLLNTEADYSARYGKDHAAVIRIRSKIRNVLSSISGELRQLAEVAKSEYLIAKKRQDNIEQELASAVSQSRETNRAKVALRELESAAQSSRSLHDSFQQRYLEVTQEQSFLLDDVRLIEPATVAALKKSSRPVKTLALFALGGMILGGGVGWLRELMDRVFRTSNQVETILQIPCVALVPLQKEVAKPAGAPLEHGSHMAPYGTRSIERSSNIATVAVYLPLSCFAESIRSIKLAADLFRRNRPGSNIAITSSLSGEGKSTIALALAQVVAQTGRRVIVVDCDLRNPSLSRTLAPDAKFGLLEVLSGEHPLCEAVWTDSVTKMAFLPVAINAKKAAGTSETLASDATEKLFGQLRQNYECVVTDLPPILPIVDVRAMAHLIDLYFLVVEWGHTKIGFVQRALNTANGVSDKLAGVVLNKADMHYIGQYDRYYTKDYYNKYYKEIPG